MAHRLTRWFCLPTGQLRWDRLVLLLLVPLLLVAFLLRLALARHSSLYIDEYTSLLAARYTTQFGVPRIPSGIYYTRGLPFTYLEAAVLALGPYDKVLARLPSVLLGTGAVLALFLVGRRLFTARAALLAAAWLALDPEAILWDGRARMYALLHFLIVLAVYYFYRGVVEESRDRARHAFVLLFLAALLTQMDAAMLLPALGVVWLLWQKPRDWLRPAVWIDLLLLAGGLALRFVLHGLMVLPGSTEASASRPFVAPGGDILAGVKALSPFFVGPSRWPASILFAAGLVALAVTLVRRGWPHLRRERAAAASLSLFLLIVWAEMVFLVGESWRSPRFLLLVLPWFFLVAAGVADRALEAAWAWCLGRWRAARVSGPARWAPAAGSVLLLLTLAAWLAPQARAATRWQDYGYDLAFEEVRRQWQPGDAVATFASSASLFFLDRCDYLAVESGFEGYTLQREGRTVDSWGLSQLLQSPADLEGALAAHPRLWFVVDTMRWQRNYSPEFRALVWQRMEPVSFQRKVLVFRTDPDPLDAAVHQPNAVDFDGQVRLVSTDLENATLWPGQTLRLAFRWQAQVPLLDDYSVLLHVDDASGKTWVVADAGATAGLFPMYEWQPGDLIVDRRELALPGDLPPGRYRIRVGLYSSATPDLLPVVAGGDAALRQATAAFFWVGEAPAVPPPAHPLEAGFGGQICLQGYDLQTASGGQAIHPGEAVGLTLHWGACGAVTRDLHTFVHLVGGDGKTVAQGDAPPMAGLYPTTFWQVGEVLADPYVVQVPAGTLPGDYTLQVGLYLLQTGERLPLAGGGDALPLATLEVRR